MRSKVNSPISISVIIPTYNAAQWLPLTIPRVEQALKNADIEQAEIIVVDDGSNDGSGDIAEKIKSQFPIRVLRQKNSGRFLARKFGTEKARYKHILFIDTRIYIAPQGLKFIADEITKHPERQVWTSHVYLDKESNIYARFWDGITTVAWRKYFSNPRDYSYGIKEFDYYPKGTTCFFVPKAIIEEANNWFVENTKDLKTSNDDTLLIRHIAEQTNININPKFSCTYHARTNLKQYVKHVHHRGKVFVDGFLRKDGNRFFYPLIAFLIFSIAVPMAVIIFPGRLLLPLLGIGAVLWVLEFVALLLLGVPLKDSASVFILSPLFAISYGTGIWKAFYKLHVKDRLAAG